MEETLHSSLWKHSAPRLTYPALTQDADVDVCIVGTGIVGITTAYLLLRAGKSVMVLDDGPSDGARPATPPAISAHWSTIVIFISRRCMAPTRRASSPRATQPRSI